MATSPSNAELARLRYCRQYGHTWPPLRQANPGDQHYCDHCESLREIRPDGQVTYVRPWE